MAVQKAMTTGTNGVMDWFDRNATSPYYSVCEIISPTKKELLFQKKSFFFLEPPPKFFLGLNFCSVGWGP